MILQPLPVLGKWGMNPDLERKCTLVEMVAKHCTFEGQGWNPPADAAAS